MHFAGESGLYAPFNSKLPILAFGLAINISKTEVLYQSAPGSPHKDPDLYIVLWSTQRLSTFMSTPRISRHVDIIINISTKEQRKNKMSIIM